MRTALPLKLVVSDIDGTLLNDQKQLLPSTVRSMERLVAAGILLATASARTISYTAEGIFPLMPLCCANAYVNGAYIETSDGRVIFDEPMEEKDVSVLIQWLDDIQASFCHPAIRSICSGCNPETFAKQTPKIGQVVESDLIGQFRYGLPVG